MNRHYDFYENTTNAWIKQLKQNNKEYCAQDWTVQNYIPMLLDSLTSTFLPDMEWIILKHFSNLSHILYTVVTGGQIIPTTVMTS